MNEPLPRNDPPGRLARSSKEPIVPTRCTHVDENGEICNAFPSWEVKGKRSVRRCEKHR